ncbi:MAG: chemotaxis protein CheA, partial [Oscillospiraceae bacterium]|nr:chemotaxis protein CheA [Oscillospiraceae bacterium]
MSDNRQPDSLMEMFIFEANQLTEQLENILLESEEKKLISPENINEIFRIMHTIKGSAAMMSFNNISTVSHKLEDLFFYIRDEKPEFEVSTVCDLVFKVLDYIRYHIENLENGEQVSDDQENEELVKMIKDYLAQIKPGQGGKVDIVKPDQSVKQPTSINIQAGEKQDKNQGAYKYKVTVFFEDYCNMIIARAFMVVNNLSKSCTNLTYFPEELNSDDKTISYIMDNGFELNIYSDLTYYDIKDLVEDITDVKTAVVQPVAIERIMEDTSAASVPNTSKQEDQSKSPVSPEPNKAEREDSRQTAVKQNIISVNINKLDKLMDIVGEIVISESMVTKNPDIKGLELENFSKAARHLRKLTDELQDMVLSVRMIPIEMSFSKMHRIVRDMSKKLNKEVTLEIIGESTEVDKNVIDNLSDPLMHLIRNCMDHGLETKEERIQNNKNPIGKITLEAKNTGGNVIITVSDDGRGLDRQRILNKARKTGLLTKNDSEVTDKEAYNFILLPGFSTKEKVTEFSGRGVGMDVVKQNIENVRGSISVDSEPGQGTVISIKIPLTLAIIDGMTIKTGNNVYVIPTQSIIQSFSPTKDSVFSDIEGNDMILVRGNCYPVLRLHKLFNIETDVTQYENGIIIMTEYNDKVVCLFADALLGQQPVVVKSLPKYLTKFGLKQVGVGGCTI